MKRLFMILFICGAIALTGCESRGRRGASSDPSPVEPPSSSEPSSSSQELPRSSLPPSSSEPSSRSAVTDPEQVSQAREIVGELLDRAAAADEIFRSALRHDSMMGAVELGDKEYLPVTDERFMTVEDIKAFWNGTFTKGGRATAAFEELQENMVYVSMNGELFISTAERQMPLTLGAWKIETFELLLMDELQLECSMETTFLGKDNGEMVLRVIRDGEAWLLGDSYFLD